MSQLEKWKEQLENKVFLIPSQREREQTRRLNTVPADLQGDVFYVASSNPINSEDEKREHFEILAIDGENSLTKKTFISTYESVCEEEVEIMPTHEAKAMREQYIQRKTLGNDDEENEDEDASFRVR